MLQDPVVNAGVVNIYSYPWGNLPHFIDVRYHTVFFSNSKCDQGEAYRLRKSVKFWAPKIKWIDLNFWRATSSR